MFRQLDPWFQYLLSMNSDNLLGVDVSKHQGDIDWRIMSDRGIKFAALRATIGDYYFDHKNYVYSSDASQFGIYLTDYHVLRTGVGSLAQMDWYFHCQKKRPDFPIVLDAEWEVKDNQLVWWSKQQNTDRILECAEIIKSRDGRWPILYSAPWYLKDFVSPLPEILKLDLFIAHYGVKWPGQNGDNKNLLEWFGYSDSTKWEFWQFYADGTVGPYYGSGSFGLDVDFFNGTQSDFERRYISLLKKLRSKYAYWRANRRLKPR